MGVNVTFTLGAVETGGTAPTSASNTVLLDYASNGPTNTWRIDPNLTSASFSTYTATSGQTYPICATSSSTACSSGGLPTLGGSNDVLIFLYGFVNSAYYSPFGCPVTTNPALGSAPIYKRFDSFAAQGYLALAPDLFWRLEPGVELPHDKAGVASAQLQLDYSTVVAPISEIEPSSITGRKESC